MPGDAMSSAYRRTKYPPSSAVVVTTVARVMPRRPAAAQQITITHTIAPDSITDSASARSRQMSGGKNHRGGGGGGPQTPPHPDPAPPAEWCGKGCCPRGHEH